MGGDGSFECDEARACGGAMACVDGTCFDICPAGISGAEEIVPTPSEPPFLGAVLMGNGADRDADGLPDLADLDDDGQLTLDDYLPPELVPESLRVSFDTDGDTVADLETVDFDGDGRPDNRYYFDDRSAWVPDADSFDDFEVVNPSTGAVEIPRGVTPVSSRCSADGIETGPPDLGFADFRPSSYCVRVLREEACLLDGQ